MAIVVATCLLAGCSPSPDDLADSLGLPPPVLDQRVAELLPTATDLGLPERDANGFPTVEPSNGAPPDCGVAPLAGGGIGAFDGTHAAIEKLFIYPDAAAARKVYRRIVEGRCPDWPNARKLKFPPLGDQSRAYVHHEDYGQTPRVIYGSWVRVGPNLIHMLAQLKKQLRNYSAAAAEAAQI